MSMTGHRQDAAVRFAALLAIALGTPAQETAHEQVAAEIRRLTECGVTAQAASAALAGQDREQHRPAASAEDARRETLAVAEAAVRRHGPAAVTMFREGAETAASAAVRAAFAGFAEQAGCVLAGSAR